MRSDSRIKSLFPVLSFLAFLLVVPAIGHAENGADKYTKAEEAFIMDYETGMVLLSKNADKRMPTSSMSKVMTMYMVFDAIRDGRLTLDDKLYVSEKAWRKGGSKMFVEVGDEVRIEDLIRGVIIQSGNDATIVLAEGLAANEAKFAEIMTEKAHELGAVNSNFVNASGWPDPDHYSTARDLAIIGQRIIKDFPEFYNYYSEKEYTYNEITQRNRNPLLYQNIGADGIKTGHTEVAGYGLIGSGSRDGRRVVMVLNGLESTSDRAKEGRRLLSWALRSFKNQTLFKEGEVVEEVPVILGSNRRIDMIVPETVRASIPKGDEDDISVKISYAAPLKAPIEKGQKIGEMTIKIPEIGTIQTPLLAAQSSEELGFLASVIAKAGLLVTGGPDVRQN